MDYTVFSMQGSSLKIGNKERNFYMDAAGYFEGDHVLVERIENKKYKCEDFILLAKDYILNH